MSRHLHLLLWNPHQGWTPIPPFVGDTLSYFDLASAKLMPNTWRILLRLRVMFEVQNIFFSTSILLYFYSLQKNSNKKHLNMLNAWKKWKLLQDTTTCNKHWQHRYFFVKGEQRQKNSSSSSIPIRNTWNLNFGEAFNLKREFTHSSKLFNLCYVFQITP